MASLYLAEGARARAKERGNIFHCVIPARRKREGLLRGRRDASRRAEIAAKFLRSLARESLFRSSALRNSPPTLSLSLSFSLSFSCSFATRLTRSAAATLTKSGLNLSRTFVERDLLARVATASLA